MRGLFVAEQKCSETRYSAGRMRYICLSATTPVVYNFGRRRKGLNTTLRQHISKISDAATTKHMGLHCLDEAACTSY